MATLVLVRHAKAAAHEGSDQARPLTGRGRADAAAAGRWLAEHRIRPNRVVVSPAVRAQQTWAALRPALSPAPEPVQDARVYDNTVPDLLAVARDTPAGISTLLLVGHNPSLAEFAAVLDGGRGEPAARSELARGLPTSGIVVYAVPVSWADLAERVATLQGFGVGRG